MTLADATSSQTAIISVPALDETSRSSGIAVKACYS